MPTNSRGDCGTNSKPVSSPDASLKCRITSESAWELITRCSPKDWTASAALSLVSVLHGRDKLVPPMFHRSTLTSGGTSLSRQPLNQQSDTSPCVSSTPTRSVKDAMRLQLQDPAGQC